MANYPLLHIGTTGEDVKKLQNALKSTPGNEDLKVDGIYGEKTKAAVSNYQRANNLSVDGIAGNQTLGHLYGLSVPDTVPDTTPTQAPQAGFNWAEQSRLDDTWNRFLNREDFSYDLENDPLYQQYKKQFTDMGLLAMEDTVGKVASLTGGYGNSYAQTAGQQTYQNYLQQLNNVAPELYGMAYDRYQAEGEALYNEALAQEKRRQQAYDRQQDNYNKLADLMSMGYSPTDSELSAAGMTRAQADAISGYYNKPASVKTTGGKTGRQYDTHGYTTEDIKALQTLAGITVDGIWGAETQAAYKAGYTKDGSKNTRAFIESLYPKEQHGVVERAAFGPYENYVIYKILTSDLTEGEKDFLTEQFGATEAIYNDLRKRELI